MRKYNNYIKDAIKLKKERQDGPEPIGLGEALEIQMEKVHEFERENAYELKNIDKVEEKTLSSLFFALLNRSRFRYSISHTFEYILKCLCLKDLEEKKDRVSIKRHYLF